MPEIKETTVWVKTSVLDEAIKLEEDGKDTRRKSREPPADKRYGWTLAKVVGGYDVLTNKKERDDAKDLVGLHVVRKGSIYGGKTVQVPVELIRESDEDVVLMANAFVDLEDGEAKLDPPDDLIKLTHLHEPSVVNCLRRRYEKDCFYTFTGANLLAINPLKQCPGLYGHSLMEKYWAAGEAETADIPISDVSEHGEVEPLPPHVYCLADVAFHSMMSAIINEEEMLNQTIVVSGESGAGKTVATRHAMEYIATVSQLRSRERKLEQIGLKGKPLTKSILQKSALRVSRNASMKIAANVERRVIQSNPILEAFGNARTSRNDNSSRFGKFTELQFKASGSLLGASIDTYLLEKVRIVHQSPGERNFHVFYELLDSATQDERERYLLEELTAKDFKMTSCSGTFDRRDGVDDYETFDELVDSLGLTGIDDDEQDKIFALIAAFLHSSNLTFLTVNDEESKVERENKYVDKVLKLLGLEFEAFDTALTSFSIQIRDQDYVRKLPKDKAEKGLEALIKSMYEALFKYIVRIINKKVAHDSTATSKPEDKQAASISMLDISGFESFDNNSFEQLCINYCNEVLHQQFTKLVFKAEQQEYISEAIEWSNISYEDNQDVLELIDRKGHGMIAILHDQCKVPGTSDRTFATNIYQAFQTNPRFKANRKQKASQKFSIVHYAGPVEYTVSGFVEKNKDEVPKEGSELLLSSSNSFVQELAKIIIEDHPPANGSRYVQNKGISHQLTTQLRAIRDRIDATSPHYIRCFKPNSDLRPNEYQPALIADQLRSAGVIEALRVSRVWYAHRYLHSDFNHRYSLLAMEELQNFNGTEKEMCRLLVDVVARQIWEIIRESGELEKKDLSASGRLLTVDENEDPAKSESLNINLDMVGLQMGQTKVFLREETFKQLEYLRGKKIHDHVIKIQANTRRYFGKRLYLRKVTAIQTFQRCVRRFLAVLKVQQVRREKIEKNIAATKIQSMWRCKVVHAQFKQEHKTDVEAVASGDDNGNETLELTIEEHHSLIQEESKEMGGSVDETEAKNTDLYDGEVMNDDVGDEEVADDKEDAEDKVEVDDQEEESNADPVDAVGPVDATGEPTDSAKCNEIDASIDKPDENEKVADEAVKTKADELPSEIKDASKKSNPAKSKPKKSTKAQSTTEPKAQGGCGCTIS